LRNTQGEVEDTEIESPFSYQLQGGVCGEKETRKREEIGTILNRNERQTIHINEDRGMEREKSESISSIDW
jgi:hypothetical protein